MESFAVSVLEEEFPLVSAKTSIFNLCRPTDYVAFQGNLTMKSNQAYTFAPQIDYNFYVGINADRSDSVMEHPGK